MHKLLGGLCAALLFLAGLPQIGHAADPVPLKTAWLGEHEAFAAWYAKQKGWDLEEGFRLEMLSYDSGKQLMAGMNTAHCLRGHSRADRIAGQPGRDHRHRQ